MKAKKEQYTFYVVFVTFSGFKVLNHIHAYYRRDSAWVHSFFGVLRLGGMVFPPRSLQAKRSNVLDVFPGKRVRSFGYDASIRAAQMGVAQRGITHLPDIYVAEVSAASKILRDIEITT